jgi:hypothetical protein
MNARRSATTPTYEITACLPQNPALRLFVFCESTPSSTSVPLESDEMLLLFHLYQLFFDY